MDVSLVMFKADGTRREFPLKKQRVIVGRKNSCDLRIPLHSVSRQHCELLVEDDVVTVRDLGSSNGTYHNSKRVQEAELGAGDELVIGPVVFTVVIDGEPTTIEPVRTILSDTKSPAESGAAPAHETSADEPAALPEDEEDEDEAAASKHGESGALDLDDPLAALEALDRDEDDEGSSLGEFEFLTDDEDEK